MKENLAADRCISHKEVMLFFIMASKLNLSHSWYIVIIQVPYINKVWPQVYRHTFLESIDIFFPMATCYNTCMLF